MNQPLLRRSVAFTLIELLVVMGIIVLIGAMVVPAVSGSLKGTALNQATQTVLAYMNNAQQTALAKGQTIELRLVASDDPDLATTASGSTGTDKTKWKVRALQMYSVETNTTVAAGTAGSLKYTPLTKLEFLPNSVIIDRGNGYSSNGNSTATSTISTLCDTYAQAPSDSGNSNAPTTLPKLPRVGTNYLYFPIDFRADGTTVLNPNKPWFLTLHTTTDGDNLTVPKSNFVTVELDAVQGSTRVFRPQ